MKIIGLTGGSGTGKSTIEGIWKDLGAEIIDADSVYHRLLAENIALKAELERAFPDAFVNGTLERKTLASIVFSDVKKLHKLHEITHKYVIDEIAGIICSLKKQGCKVAVIEALYMLDTELINICQDTVAVVSYMEKRLKRIEERDGLTPEQSWARVKNQNSDEYFLHGCDYTIENNGTLAELKQKATDLFKQLTV